MYIVYQRLNIAGCRASGFLSTTAALAEVWSLAAVSLDRLLSIYYPLDKRKRITKSQVVSGKTLHRNVLQFYTLEEMMTLISREKLNLIFYRRMHGLF